MNQTHLARVMNWLMDLAPKMIYKFLTILKNIIICTCNQNKTRT